MSSSLTKEIYRTFCSLFIAASKSIQICLSDREDDVEDSVCFVSRLIFDTTANSYSSPTKTFC